MVYGHGDHLVDHLSHTVQTVPLFASVGFRERTISPIPVAELVDVVVAALDGRLSRRTVAVRGGEALLLSEAVRGSPRGGSARPGVPRAGLGAPGARPADRVDDAGAARGEGAGPDARRGRDRGRAADGGLPADLARRRGSTTSTSGRPSRRAVASRGGTCGCPDGTDAVCPRDLGYRPQHPGGSSLRTIGNPPRRSEGTTMLATLPGPHPDHHPARPPAPTRAVIAAAVTFGRSARSARRSRRHRGTTGRSPCSSAARDHAPGRRRRILDGTAEVDDVVQETFLTAWLRMADLVEATRSRVARHDRPTTQLRPAPCSRSSPSRRVRADAVARTDDCPDAVASARRWCRWPNGSSAPAARAATCWELRHLGCLSYREIADAVGLPESTVRGQIGGRARVRSARPDWR